MGYSTDFDGVLKFKNELTIPQLKHLDSILGQDCRDHKDWNAKGLYFIDLELTDDYNGIRWDQSEKTSDMDKLLNVVIQQMRKKFPDFTLIGSLEAQGEDPKDHYFVTINANTGLAQIVKSNKAKKSVKCPHCHEYIEMAYTQLEGDDD
jgi:hypothetical protein